LGRGSIPRFSGWLCEDVQPLELGPYSGTSVPTSCISNNELKLHRSSTRRNTKNHMRGQPLDEAHLARAERLTVIMVALARARYLRGTKSASSQRLVRELRSLQEAADSTNVHHRML